MVFMMKIKCRHIVKGTNSKSTKISGGETPPDFFVNYSAFIKDFISSIKLLTNNNFLKGENKWNLQETLQAVS